MTRGLLGLILLGAGGILIGGRAGHAAAQGAGDVAMLSAGAGTGLRSTNVELYIVSQSCFQGEVVPCG